MLSNHLTLPLLTLFVCSLQAGEVNAANQSLTQNTAETAPTKPLIGGAPAPQAEAANKTYLNLGKYKKLLPKLHAAITENKDEKTKNAADLAAAKKIFTELQKLAPSFSKAVEDFTQKKCPGFAGWTEDDKKRDFDAELNKAQAALTAFENRLLQQLKLEYEQLKLSCDLNNQHSQKALDSLGSRCLDLEGRFLQIPGDTTDEYVKRLAGLKAALIRRGEELKEELKKLAADEEAQREVAATQTRRASEEFTQNNTTWKKLTRTTSKYGFPVILALSVAAGLTYGETKHKFISKLIWGKQPEKVIQLSWWARNWSWFKRLLRLHA